MDIETGFGLLTKATSTFDNRYVSKVLRGIGPLRRELGKDVSPLTSVINSVYGGKRSYLTDAKTVGTLAEVVADSMDVSSDNDTVEPAIDLYIHLLIQIYLLDTNQLQPLDNFNSEVIKLMAQYNHRSLDFLEAKIWFYICRTKELANDLFTIRGELTQFLRIAILRHDNETCGSIITLLLRNYLLTKDINQALNLIEKCQFPDEVSNSLSARYFYYLAKIHAIQLNYSLANDCCISAIRKAPQTKLSQGFIQSVTKLNILIELLMGDIPELKVFKTHGFEPYFMVTKAVKYGDLKLFESVLTKYKADFIKDDNYSLISRLHQNVIKTGIRIISLSYAKISLKDICIKLHLDSEESTEYIVAKSIRDGVIDATINHEKGYMQSKELSDIYSTKLPQDEFNQRIQFCLSLHNDSVKSMRYPSDNSKELKVEVQDDELELLKALEEGDLDDFMD